MKVVKRKNPKADKMSKFRKQNQNLPTSPHLALTDKLGTTEHKIRKEIAIMKKCNHPHIVKLLEVIDDNLNEKIYMGTLSGPSYCSPCTRWLYACPRLATRVCPVPLEWAALIRDTAVLVMERTGPCSAAIRSDIVPAKGPLDVLRS